MVSVRVYPTAPPESGARRPKDDFLNVDSARIRSGARQGSSGNVLAALASFFIPGLGQLVQGRLMSAVFLFIATSVGYALWFLILPGLLAFLLHIAAVVDAATWREPETRIL